MTLKDNDNFVENSDIIELYLKELKYFSEIEGGLLTKEEEDELGYRILEGDKEAINTIVKRNLRLVISVAKHYKDFGLDFVDLIQHGMMLKEDIDFPHMQLIGYNIILEEDWEMKLKI